MKYDKDNVRLIISGALTAAVASGVILSLFFVFRDAVSRFSMDFYYPYLRTVRSAEDASAAAILAGSSRTELAASLVKERKRNELLASELAAMKALKDENASLRAMLDLSEKDGFTPVRAEVLHREIISWDRYFTIDKGENDGIQKGDLVLAAASTGRAVAAGRVIETSRRSAKVATLYDADCRLSVFFTEAGAYGTLSGSGTQVIAGSLPLDRKYQAGDVVETSGFTDMTPRGIPVGVVASEKSGAAEVNTRKMLFAEAVIEPFCDVKKIRFVTVLVKPEKKEGAL